MSDFLTQYLAWNKEYAALSTRGNWSAEEINRINELQDLLYDNRAKAFNTALSRVEQLAEENTRMVGLVELLMGVPEAAYDSLVKTARAIIEYHAAQVSTWDEKDYGQLALTAGDICRIRQELSGWLNDALNGKNASDEILAKTNYIKGLMAEQIK